MATLHHKEDYKIIRLLTQKSKRENKMEINWLNYYCIVLLISLDLINAFGETKLEGERKIGYVSVSVCLGERETMCKKEREISSVCGRERENT